MSTLQDKQEALHVAALKEIQETNWAFTKAVIMHSARLTKIKYDAYLAEGFDHGTALHIATK